MVKNTYIESESDAIWCGIIFTYEGNGVFREQRFEEVYSRKDIAFFKAKKHINICATTRLEGLPRKCPPHDGNAVIKIRSERILRCRWSFVVLSPHALL